MRKLFHTDASEITQIRYYKLQKICAIRVIRVRKIFHTDASDNTDKIL